MKKWIRVPVVDPIDPRRCNVFEHTPLDYFRHGEYPRFIRPVGHNEPRSEWKLVDVSSDGKVDDLLP